MMNVYILTACCYLILRTVSGFKCHRGHFKYYTYFGPPICIPCFADTYMSEDNHEYTSCRPCSTPNVHNHEVLVRNCTSTTDAVIECVAGFFGQIVGPHGYVDLECNICSTCSRDKSFVVRNCSKTSDTVCCQNPESALELNANGTTVCKNATVNDSEFVCQKGQYLDSNGSRPICRECPAGSFLDKDNHRYSNCVPCTEPNYHSHEVLLSNCTTVSDTVIGCRRGYFGILRHERDLDCLRCSDCDSRQMITVRPCGETFDAVCCSRHGLRIQDTNDGQGRCLYGSTPLTSPLIG